MKRFTLLEKSVLLCAGVLLLGSCATNNVMTLGGNPITGGQAVEVRGVYSVRAPSGDGWKVKIDKTKGFIGFNRRRPDEKHPETEGKFTVMGVFPGYLFTGKENQIEEIIADMLLTDFEKVEAQRCVASGCSLGDISKNVVTIGNKRLYARTYTVSGRSPVAEMKIAEYLFLPPEIKYTSDFYVFRIADVASIEETVYETDLNIIHEVIESFQFRNVRYR